MDNNNAEPGRDIKRCTDPADPKRCQAVTKDGQCMMLSVPEGQNCMLHGGNKQLDQQEKHSADMYRVSVFKGRIARQKNHSEVRTLGNEVAILRMLLEERLNKCASETDLMLESAKISELVIKIEKLVTSCHKLEKHLGQHLDKAAILQFAGEVVEIVGKTVTDKEQIKAVADGILVAIGNLGMEDSG